ncbi:MAG: baculoviral IAP repeat-containing protein, partial [Endozoicomonas sp.]
MNGTDTRNKPLPMLLPRLLVSPGNYQNRTIPTDPLRQNTTVQTMPVENSGNNSVNQTTQLSPLPQAAPTQLSPLPQTSPSSTISGGTNHHFEFAYIAGDAHEQLLRRSNLRSEHDRLRTFSGMRRTHVSYEALAKNGFFYLGNLDRTQCYFCSVVLKNWRPGDDVATEHRKHKSACRMLLNRAPDNIPLSQPQTALPPLSAEQMRELALLFPCQNPYNSDMRDINVRHETFRYPWFNSDIHATSYEVASAGFFYLGESDRVKCWYCSGGLQNWNRNDNPWTEHAKWYPQCEFLLQNAGPEYVFSISKQYPGLQRPAINQPQPQPQSQQQLQSGYESEVASIGRNSPRVVPEQRAERVEALGAAIASNTCLRELYSHLNTNIAAECIIGRFDNVDNGAHQHINNIILNPSNNDVADFIFITTNGDFCKGFNADDKCHQHQNNELPSTSGQENNTSNSVAT